MDPDIKLKLKLNLISVSEEVVATTVAYERVQHCPLLPELNHSLRLPLKVHEDLSRWWCNTKQSTVPEHSVHLQLQVP